MSAKLTFKQRFDPRRFTVGEAPAPGPVTLTHRRIFILPTLSGLGYAGSLVLVLLIAFVYNNNLAYMLGFVMAGIFFVTMLHTFKSLAGLVVQPGRAEPVFAGQSAVFEFVLHNPAPVDRPAIHVRLHHSKELSLATMESVRCTLHQDTYRRGWQACDTVTVSSSYPLGLFRAWSPLRFQMRVLVYPRPGLLPISGVGSMSGNDVEAIHRGHGDDFFGLRPYQAGDSRRQIHWRSLAKGGALHSKLYEGANKRELWFRYDQTPGNHAEERLSQLCRWICDAENAGLRYGLALPGTEIPIGSGRHHYLACLRAVALF